MSALRDITRSSLGTGNDGAMLAYSTSDYIFLSAATLAFFVGAYFSARTLQSALHTGSVSYGGNAPRTSRSTTYRRSDTPAMYWFGVGLYVFLTLMCVTVGCVFTYLLASN